MTHKPLLVSVAAFVLAVILALASALILVGVIERRTVSSLAAAFDEAGIDWIEVGANGLQAELSGTAPNESARIQALRIAGSVIDSSRVSETLVVPMRTASVAPVFRIEMMRDRQNVSVIGLVPDAGFEDPFVDRLSRAVPGAEIADMLQSADHAVPVGWVAAVDFAVQGLALFDVGRISVTAGRIEVEALVDSPETRTRLERQLRDIAPRGQVLVLDLPAPRPVATPFLLRLDHEQGALRLGACSADTEAAQARILAALRSAGLQGRPVCPLALGAPSPRWGEAAEMAIATLVSLDAGSLTLSDGSVSLTVPHTVAAAAFDRAVGRLETRLPEAFSLTARRLEAPQEAQASDDARPEVSMVLTDAGQLTISGRLPDTRIREAVQVFAQARFGAQAVELAARIDGSLPQGWSVRVLGALEALAELHHGSAVVRADQIEISGVSGNPDAAAQVTQAIVQSLGADTEFALNVTYDEALDPVSQLPTPDNCEARIRGILAETKITFDPGSIEINAESGAVIDRIADVLRECGELPFEVAGHTDSQGREETNLGLSQARAEAVINALMTRRVLVASLVAQGYGAAHPIADNGTEVGREANRRIEFTLIRPEPEPVPLDPALEAELVFEIQTPDGNTTRPRERPAALVGAATAEPDDAPQDN
jgi:OOP family OmpA-OmpF porin